MTPNVASTTNKMVKRSKKKLGSGWQVLVGVTPTQLCDLDRDEAIRQIIFLMERLEKVEMLSDSLVEICNDYRKGIAGK